MVGPEKMGGIILTTSPSKAARECRSGKYRRVRNSQVLVPSDSQIELVEVRSAFPAGNLAVLL